MYMYDRRTSLRQADNLLGTDDLADGATRHTPQRYSAPPHYRLSAPIASTTLPSCSRSAPSASSHSTSAAIIT
eukprot:scaffold77430_cov66-Phaeocystis_antarctica.AAC.6